jgi:hypothetical protein
MTIPRNAERTAKLGAALLVTGLILGAARSSVIAQSPTTAADVTYTKDVAPILQRSCENCHRANGVAPMSLSNYEQVRPWARAIKSRTGMGPRAGLMPPWYVEKNLGIQKFKDDVSLSDREIATIAKWVDNGAPRGNTADMPAPKSYDDSKWHIGTPDFIVRTTDITVKAGAPDWWGEMPAVPIDIDDDHYVVALEMREVNNVDNQAGTATQTVGGRYIIHHMVWSTRVIGTAAEEANRSSSVDESSTFWPVHEVGRNADFFDLRAVRLLKKGSTLDPSSVHLHSNGRDTTAHLEIGFKFAPKGVKPEFKRASQPQVGNGIDIDIRPMEANQQLHAYTVLSENVMIQSFEPHLHAPGVRMCLEAIWGFNIQTLNCVGYDHNWVRAYNYDDDAMPLLPKGTILHLTGYVDNSPSNKNVVDPRNWQGAGNRSVANMFNDIGARVALTDEQFLAEMARRRERLHWKKGELILGCPLCAIAPPVGGGTGTAQQQQQ